MSRTRERSSRYRAATLSGAVLLFGLTACTGPAPTSPEPSRQPVSSSAPESLSASAAEPVADVPATIAEDLDAPWSLAFIDDRALVSERDSGRIVEVSASGAVREVGVIADVAAGGEGGQLGIAVREGFLYAYLTTADGNRVQRQRLSGGAGAWALGPPEMLLTGVPAARNHNGGRIAFGPDGKLYVTVGDAGNRAAAQELDSLSGKILRMEPDGAVPADNPFPGSLVYSLGHRNPQGIGWGPDGTMYASEFGQDTWDELNVIAAGQNYGWPVVEGIAGDARYVDPVQQWAPAEASPSGLAVTDEAIVIANLRGQRLRTVPLDDLGSSVESFVGEYGRLRDVAVAPDGTLWVVTNNTDGRGDPRPGDDRILRIPVPSA
ncbi:PQQ-dependent sugar dehydrogenase [Microbacterium gorillae]|uniref:PQQ-dependent sugar dehydrogenase n=1 Tax=Microbacterium gorillae TaxID=1231063 RepID=UPI000590C958|nr:PQQ-dependent sugar dehydrogenase [Microbacterium gorillae]